MIFKPRTLLALGLCLLALFVFCPVVEAGCRFLPFGARARARRAARQEARAEARAYAGASCGRAGAGSVLRVVLPPYRR